MVFSRSSDAMLLLYPAAHVVLTADPDYPPPRLVLETLKPLPEDRKCFRMINGVLVERTVKDVVPQLQTNSDGLKKVLDDLLKQYTSKQEELEKWKVGVLRHGTIRRSIMLTLHRFRTRFRLFSSDCGSWVNSHDTVHNLMGEFSERFGIVTNSE